MDMEEYNAMAETLHLVSNKANRTRLDEQLKK